MNVLNGAGVSECAPFSGGESVLQHLFARLCRPGAEQKGFGRRLGSLGECWKLKCSPVVACRLRMKSQSSLWSPSSHSRTPNCSSPALSRLHGCRVEGCVSPAIRQERVGGHPRFNQPLVLSTESTVSPQQPCQLLWMFVHMWLFFIILLQRCTGRGIHFQHRLLIWLLIFDLGSQIRLNYLTWVSVLPSFSSRVIHTCSCTPKSPSQIAFWSKTHSKLFGCLCLKLPPVCHI